MTDAYRTQFGVSILEQVFHFRAFEIPQCFDDVLFNVVNRVVMAAMRAAERFGYDRVDQSEFAQILARQS